MSKYTSPPDNCKLRAFLVLVDDFLQKQDKDRFEAVSDLSKELIHEDDCLKTFVTAVRERIYYPDEQYRICSDEEFGSIRVDLQKRAYGDFDEAMEALESDLRQVDPTIKRDYFATDVFRPELFENSSDRRKWSELHSVLMKWRSDTSKDYTQEANRAIRLLRVYQQKTYGPLVPVISATYRKGNEGYSVSMAWIDTRLCVKTYAPFYESMDDYFIHKKPVRSMQEFNVSMLPHNLDGYVLQDTVTRYLFVYEFNEAFSV